MIVFVLSKTHYHTIVFLLLQRVLLGSRPKCFWMFSFITDSTTPIMLALITFSRSLFLKMDKMDRISWTRRS